MKKLAVNGSVLVGYQQFDGFHIETVPIQYTVGGGRGVERNELIIFSWDDAAQPVGLF